MLNPILVWINTKSLGLRSWIKKPKAKKKSWDYWGFCLGLISLGLFEVTDKQPFAAFACLAAAFVMLLGGLYSLSWRSGVKHSFAMAMLLSFSAGTYIWINSMNKERIEQSSVHLPKPAPAIPKIAIIQGEGGFGELHRQAVKYALQQVVPTEALSLDCAQSLADIKAGKSDKCMDQLRQWLDNQDVVAAVGPSATEATRSTIDTINHSGYKIPVFATSAAPRSELQWPGMGIPVFRISTGIDERADELAKLTHYLVDHKVHVLFLVEHNWQTNVATYGERLESAIRLLDNQYWADHLNDGTVSRLEYQTGQIDQKCDSLNNEVQKKQVIFLLGIGSDFRTVIDRCYGSKASQAKLMGFMNAYTIASISHESLTNIFEITDLDINSIASSAKPDALNHFEAKFGPLSPAVRDQAFSYDVGTILSKALEELHNAVSANPALKYSDALAIMTNAIQKTDFDGITGHIRFATNKQGTHLQNAQTKLTLTQYDSRKHKWVIATRDELLAFR
ncbi:MAG TPA: hypothetical protein VFR24_14100 [Candidatus Angelobacter sp.]|nr:hypothetical protein [Candidatus Angelobacter sp.]